MCLNYVLYVFWEFAWFMEFLLIHSIILMKKMILIIIALLNKSSINKETIYGPFKLSFMGLNFVSDHKTVFSN